MELLDKEYWKLLGKRWTWWCSFLNVQKQLPLGFIYLYPMADRQDERPLWGAQQKHGLSQRFPTVHHLSRSLIWLSNQGNTSSLDKTHGHTNSPYAHTCAKNTSTWMEMWTHAQAVKACAQIQNPVQFCYVQSVWNQWQTDILRARSS